MPNLTSYFINNFIGGEPVAVVMKNGKIVEFGTYYELINNNATFKSLVEFSK